MMMTSEVASSRVMMTSGVALGVPSVVKASRVASRAASMLMMASVGKVTSALVVTPESEMVTPMGKLT